MRHTRISSALAVTIATSLAVSTSVAVCDTPPPREATVVIQSDGTHCNVEKAVLLCSEVVSYLREVLKLPARARIHLQPNRATPYESVMKVVDMLNKSEYPIPVGYLAPEYADE